MTAKMTLLEMVQNILSDMDSDEVNSLSDTVEAQQVASIIKDEYYLLISNQTIPERFSLFTVEGLGDTARPNYLKLPTSVDKLLTLRYNTVDSGDTDTEYKELRYLSPEDFLDLVLRRNTSAANIDEVTDASGVKLFIINDQDPTYWTSFDDEFIVCDSYDSNVDTTLQSSKTLGYGSKLPTFSVADDDFTPDIDDNLFPLLLAEAKATAFVNLKQMQNGRIEAKARNQKVMMQNDRYRYKKDRSGPNYGR